MKRIFLLINIFLIAEFLMVGNAFSASRGEKMTVQKITKLDAIAIAQNLMREKKLDKDWNIAKPKIQYEEEKEIGIKFYTKHPFSMNLKLALPYLVVVSKQDGKVIAFGQDK